MNLISNNKTTMYEELKKNIINSDEIIMNVSFIRDSGLKLLIPDLLTAKKSGKKIKILTSDYMHITEPNALYRLLEISEVKIFKNDLNISFHPKTYIFKNKKNITAFIGSSNISYSALTTGVEWNYKIDSENDLNGILELLNEFENLYCNNSFDLTLEWLRNYEKKYKKNDILKIIDPTEKIKIENEKLKKLEPIKFQIPALYELSKTREEGYKKAMVVVGTGLGKTYLSAFDSMNFNKILFVAHRDEILKDASKTFFNVYENKKTYGFFNGEEKSLDKDIIFASVMTLGKESYLNSNYFSENYFDYIVIDEFHHSNAISYRKILDYFNPKFLLGLTATPDRNDNGDVYELCDYNVAYECDFRVGINNGWLTPFEYFGIYDETDYSLIPWRSGKYDLEELENKLIIEKRMELVYKKYLEYRKKSTIGFCASVKHCKFMHEYFSKKKIKSAMIIGETSIIERQRIIQEFKDGKLDIIFTVDVFNEGVDIPCIDTILFLRPTTSYTIFIQQLGRGLRTFEDKEKLRVIDFVGNYKGAELKPSFLAGENRNKRKISPIDSNFILPSGCTANFDFKLIEYFEENKGKYDKLEDKIKNDFRNVKEILGRTPSIMDIYTFGEVPVHSYLQKFKSWYNFLERTDELNEQQKIYSSLVKDFLQFLEKTSMTKSYKIPLFLSIFENLEREKSLEDIGKYFAEFYNDKVHGKDLNNKKHDDWKNWDLKKFMNLAEENPIYFLTRDGKNRELFIYEDKKFSLSLELFNEILENKNVQEDIKNILKYRNINYFNRKYMEV